MNFDYSTRVKVVIILMILFVLLSNIQLIRREIRFYKFIGRDEVTLHEKRFEGLRKMLSPYGVVGYITDKKFKAKEAGLTQYTLSPVIVVNNTQHQLVVGDFRNADTKSKISLNKNFIILKDLGNGVMLFSREVK